MCVLTLSWRWHRRSWERNQWVSIKRLLRHKTSFQRLRYPRMLCSTHPISRERALGCSTHTVPSWTPSTPRSCRLASATRTPHRCRTRSSHRPSVLAGPVRSTTRIWPASAWTQPSLRPAARRSSARSPRQHRPAGHREPTLCQTSWRRPRPTGPKCVTATGSGREQTEEETATRRRRRQTRMMMMDEERRGVWVRPSMTSAAERRSKWGWAGFIYLLL